MKTDSRCSIAVNALHLYPFGNAMQRSLVQIRASAAISAYPMFFGFVVSGSERASHDNMSHGMIWRR